MADSVATWVLIAFFIGAALSFYVISGKMEAGRLRPNSFVGIRIPKSLRSEEDWYLVQSSCAWYVRLFSFVFLDCAVLFFLLEIVAVGIPFVVPTLVSMVQVVVVAALMARRASSRGKGDE